MPNFKQNRHLILATTEVSEGEDYRDLLLGTRNGEFKIRFYDIDPATEGVIMLGGVGGDFDTPAREVYPRLAKALQQEGIVTLRVQFRDPIDLDSSTFDVLAGIEFLHNRGIERMAIVGHSFGGAVAIQAGLRSNSVATVVTLSTQGFGTDGIEDLSPRPILLVHGYADEVLPPTCSIDAYNRAGEPKTLKLLEGARHAMDEAADEVYETVRVWLIEKLRTPPEED